MLFDVPGWNLSAPKTANVVEKKRKPDRKKEKKPQNQPPSKQGKPSSEHKYLDAPKFALKPVKVAKPVATGKKPTALEKREEKLKGSRFRFLNQRLYQSRSDEALAYFKEHPEEFECYHEGFRSQVAHWPVNPVDIFIGELEQILRERSGKGQLIVADMGCGDAKIMQSFSGDGRIKVHSFDLAASVEGVVVCDMSRVPLPSQSVDFVIFSLSLMNTNFLEALREAGRILKHKTGTVFIAEVESRFEKGDPTDFVKAVEEIGFRSINVDTSFSVFLLFQFLAGNCKSNDSGKTNNPDQKPVLKPCLYKKR